LRWRIVAVDKPKLSYARGGVAFYRERLGALAKVELLTVRSGPQAARRQLELSEGWFRVVLDERGELVRSLELARRIEQWAGRGVGRVALLVGGAEGHADEVRAAADWLWSLSPLTLQHELALVVAMEQIYRAYMIKRRSPYHRE